MTSFTRLEQGTIRIAKTNAEYKRERKFCSYHPVFNNEYVIVNHIEDYNVVEIIAPDLDYRGKSYKTQSFSTGRGYKFFTKVCDVDFGDYKIDEEESNEDKLVFYLDEKIN